MGDSCSFDYPDHKDLTSEKVTAENRQLSLEAFRGALGPEYPACWVSGKTSCGDFPGRDVAVDVFNVPLEKQRELLRRLEDVRDRVKGLIGSRCIFILHTPKATQEHYRELVAELTQG